MKMWLLKLWSKFGSIRDEVHERPGDIDQLDRRAQNAVRAMDEQISLMQGKSYVR